MNPALCVVMIAAGGTLLLLAVLGYVLGWFGTGTALALGVLGALIDTAGALLLAYGRRHAAGRPRA